MCRMHDSSPHARIPRHVPTGSFVRHLRGRMTPMPMQYKQQLRVIAPLGVDGWTTIPQNYPQQLLQKPTKYVHAQCTSCIGIMQFSHCADSQRAVLHSMMTTVERPQYRSYECEKSYLKFSENNRNADIVKFLYLKLTKTWVWLVTGNLR